jgi:hypothetical protein
MKVKNLIENLLNYGVSKNAKKHYKSSGLPEIKTDP